MCRNNNNLIRSCTTMAMVKIKIKMMLTVAERNSGLLCCVCFTAMATRRLHHLNINTCCYGAVTEMTDSIIFPVRTVTFWLNQLVGIEIFTHDKLC